MKTEILRALREKDDHVSGVDLCKDLGVSRTAIWKVIKSLRDEGYVIEALQNKGYRLVSAPDCISESEIKSCLATKWLGRELVCYDTTDSTNTQAKLLAENGATEGTVVAAEMQTKGRGRRGRTWLQNRGDNISMSIILRPEINPDKASMLTLCCALSIARAIKSFCSAEVRIKWPNDIVMEGRKICGILTEMSAERDYVHYVVAGFGINVNGRDFPEDIRDIASSIYGVTGKKTQRSRLIAAVLKEFETVYESFLTRGDLSYIRDEYNSMLISRDKEVKVLDPQGGYTGISRGITGTGELIVETHEGREQLVGSGEVSVRGLYGYV